VIEDEAVSMKVRVEAAKVIVDRAERIQVADRADPRPLSDDAAPSVEGLSEVFVELLERARAASGERADLPSA
jgi:hypothetical protein